MEAARRPDPETSLVGIHREIDDVDRRRSGTSLLLSGWFITVCLALIALAVLGPVEAGERLMLLVTGVGGAATGLALFGSEWPRWRRLQRPGEDRRPGELLARLDEIEARPGVVAGRHFPGPTLFLVLTAVLVIMGLGLVHGSGGWTGWAVLVFGAWSLGTAAITSRSREIGERMGALRERLHALEAAAADADEPGSGEALVRRRRIEQELARHGSSVWRWRIVVPLMVAWVLAPLLDIDGAGSFLGYAIYLLLVAAPLSVWAVRKTLTRTREVRELEDELDELWRLEAVSAPAPSPRSPPSGAAGPIRPPPPGRPAPAQREPGRRDPP